MASLLMNYAFINGVRARFIAPAISLFTPQIPYLRSPCMATLPMLDNAMYWRDTFTE